MEELLKFFKDNDVAVQLTIDLKEKPTVHAFKKQEGIMLLHFTDGETIVEALENMKTKLFG